MSTKGYIFRDLSGNMYRDNTSHGVVCDDGSGGPCGCCPKCVSAAKSSRCSDDTVDSYNVRLSGVKTDCGCFGFDSGAALSASFSGDINGFDMCMAQQAGAGNSQYGFSGPGPLTASYYSGPACTGFLGTNSDINAVLENNRTLGVSVGGIAVFSKATAVGGFVKCNEAYTLANELTRCQMPGDFGTWGGYAGNAAVRPCCNPAP